MKTIGIIGAMPEEIKHYMMGIHEKDTETYGGVEYHVGKREHYRIVICCAGMGKVNAASTTQVLITRYKVDAIIFSGIAGNMTDVIGMGDVVIGKELVYHDATDELLAMSSPGTAQYTAHPLLIDIAEQACRLVGVNHIVGRIATGDQFIKDPAVKKAIQDHCHPHCVEMEGAATAQVCMKSGIPFVVIRIMSDDANDNFENLQTNLELDNYVKTATAVVHAMLDSFEKMDI